MCGYVDNEYIAPGWGCCHCLAAHGAGQYNGIQRTTCKACGKARCTELTPDKDTNRLFANRLHHKNLYTELDAPELETVTTDKPA